jgi:hypothetical protein
VKKNQQNHHRFFSSFKADEKEKEQMKKKKSFKLRRVRHRRLIQMISKNNSAWSIRRRIDRKFSSFLPPSTQPMRKRRKENSCHSVA